MASAIVARMVGRSRDGSRDTVPMLPRLASGSGVLDAAALRRRLDERRLDAIDEALVAYLLDLDGAAPAAGAVAVAAAGPTAAGEDEDVAPLPPPPPLPGGAPRAARRGR